MYVKGSHTCIMVGTVREGSKYMYYGLYSTWRIHIHVLWSILYVNDPNACIMVGTVCEGSKYIYYGRYCMWRVWIHVLWSVLYVVDPNTCIMICTVLKHPNTCVMLGTVLEGSKYMYYGLYMKDTCITMYYLNLELFWN